MRDDRICIFIQDVDFLALVLILASQPIERSYAFQIFFDKQQPVEGSILYFQR